MTRDEIKAAALAAIQGANPWTPEALASALADRLAPVDLQARYDMLLKELRRERAVNDELERQIAPLRLALGLRPASIATWAKTFFRGDHG